MPGSNMGFVYFDKPLTIVDSSTSSWFLRYNNVRQNVLSVVPVPTNGIQINTAAGSANVGADVVNFNIPPITGPGRIESDYGRPVIPFTFPMVIV